MSKRRRYTGLRCYRCKGFPGLVLTSERRFAENFGFVLDLHVFYVDIEEFKGVALLLKRKLERQM